MEDGTQGLLDALPLAFFFFLSFHPSSHSLPSETGSPVIQASLELAMPLKKTLDFRFSCSCLPVLGLRVCCTMPSLCHARDGTKGFVLTRHALCLLNYTPKPFLLGLEFLFYLFV